MGSSPRMRGTRHHARLETVETGIIPAYAGNTRERHGTVSDRRDHPRVCGEHILGDSNADIHRGSSPRMRGTRGGGIGALRLVGIIPAYAGNTTLALLRDVWVLNHPRVCGEHQMYGSLVGWDSGSSPRMRGTPSGVVGFVYKAGIIPAYAGNTFSRFLGMPDGWDHPRVCGEHRLFSIRFLSYRGSSPRMRGTLGLPARHRYESGIIPAYAGNTMIHHAPLALSGDHPRVCGEH